MVATYQSVSGAGKEAMDELWTQTKGIFVPGQEVAPRKFTKQIAFNVIPHIDVFMEDGTTKEEWKMVAETKKILDPAIRVTATCVRVPVLRAHSESINVEFAGERPPLSAVREALFRFPGVRLVDDVEHNRFPMPVEATGRDEVLVGRVRNDLSNGSAIEMFVCGDQILKGAALNGLQIAREWIRLREAA